MVGSRILRASKFVENRITTFKTQFIVGLNIFCHHVIVADQKQIVKPFGFYLCRGRGSGMTLSFKRRRGAGLAREGRGGRRRGGPSEPPKAAEKIIIG